MINLVLAFLDERWKRPLDITTIGQALEALGHEPDDNLRWEVFETLQTNPGRLSDKKRYGVAPVTVTLSNEEKLAGRALLFGEREEEAREAAAIPVGRWASSKEALVRVGLLASRGWRPADGHERILDGVGLFFHTVRKQNETFNVP
jgi:hypothetical protein